MNKSPNKYSSQFTFAPWDSRYISHDPLQRGSENTVQQWWSGLQNMYFKLRHLYKPNSLYIFPFLYMSWSSLKNAIDEILEIYIDRVTFDIVNKKDNK